MTNAPAKVARLATDTISSAAPAAQAAMEGARETTARTAETVTGLAENGAANLRAALERGMEQAGKAAEGGMKAAQEMAEFSRGNAEAMAQVTQTWIAGTQDLSRQAFSFAQAMADHAMEGVRALSGVKSLKDAAEIQVNLARGTVDKVMSETTRMQEASMRLVEQVAAPMTQRMTLAMERATKSASV